MKVKIFNGNPAYLQSDINEWFASNPGIDIIYPPITTRIDDLRVVITIYYK